MNKRGIMKKIKTIAIALALTLFISTAMDCVAIAAPSSWINSAQFEGENAFQVASKANHKAKNPWTVGWTAEGVFKMISGYLANTAGALTGQHPDSLKDDEVAWIDGTLGRVIASIGAGFDLLMWNAGMGINTVVYGSSAEENGTGLSEFSVNGETLKPAELFQFSLNQGNPYGYVGAITYSALRIIASLFVAVFVMAQLAKAGVTTTGNDRSLVKEAVVTGIMTIIFLFIMPNVVDLIVHIKQVLLKTFANLVSGEGVPLDLVEATWSFFVADSGILNGILFDAAVFFVLYLSALYVGVGLATAALFGFFPIIAIMSYRDKGLLTGWLKQVIGAIFTPVIDAILFLVPGLIFSMAGFSAESTTTGEISGLMVGMSLLALITCFFMVPARQAIKAALGFGGNSFGEAAGMGALKFIGNTAKAVVSAGLKAAGLGMDAIKNDKELQDKQDELGNRAKMHEQLAKNENGGLRTDTSMDDKFNKGKDGNQGGQSMQFSGGTDRGLGDNISDDSGKITPNSYDDNGEIINSPEPIVGGSESLGDGIAPSETSISEQDNSVINNPLNPAEGDPNYPQGPYSVDSEGRIYDKDGVPFTDEHMEQIRDGKDPYIQEHDGTGHYEFKKGEQGEHPDVSGGGLSTDKSVDSSENKTKGLGDTGEQRVNTSSEKREGTLDENTAKDLQELRSMTKNPEKDMIPSAELKNDKARRENLDVIERATQGIKDSEVRFTNASSRVADLDEKIAAERVSKQEAVMAGDKNKIKEHDLNIAKLGHERSMAQREVQSARAAMTDYKNIKQDAMDGEKAFAQMSKNAGGSGATYTSQRDYDTTLATNATKLAYANHRNYESREMEGVLTNAEKANFDRQRIAAIQQQRNQNMATVAIQMAGQVAKAGAQTVGSAIGSMAGEEMSGMMGEISGDAASLTAETAATVVNIPNANRHPQRMAQRANSKVASAQKRVEKAQSSTTTSATRVEKASTSKDSADKNYVRAIRRDSLAVDPISRKEVNRTAAEATKARNTYQKEVRKAERSEASLKKAQTQLVQARSEQAKWGTSLRANAEASANSPKPIRRATPISNMYTETNRDLRKEQSSPKTPDSVGAKQPRKFTLKSAKPKAMSTADYEMQLKAFYEEQQKLSKNERGRDFDGLTDKEKWEIAELYNSKFDDDDTHAQ